MYFFCEQLEGSGSILCLLWEGWQRSNRALLFLVTRRDSIVPNHIQDEKQLPQRERSTLWQAGPLRAWPESIIETLIHCESDSRVKLPFLFSTETWTSAMNRTLSSTVKGVNFITSQTTFERMFTVLASDYKELSTCRCSPTISSYSIRGDNSYHEFIFLNLRRT